MRFGYDESVIIAVSLFGEVCSIFFVFFLTKARPTGTLIAAAIIKATGKLRENGRARKRAGDKKGKTPAGRAYEIGYFRVPKTLTFKMRPSAQPFL